MSIDYTEGLNAALAISVLLTIALLFFGIQQLAWGLRGQAKNAMLELFKNLKSLNKILAFAAFGLFLVYIIAVLPVIFFYYFITVFPPAYSLASLFFQGPLGVEFFEAELSSGTVALRIVSLIAFANVIKYMYISRRILKLQKAHDWAGRAVTEKQSIKSNRLLSMSHVVQSIYSQSSFYMLAISLLWVFKIYDIDSLATHAATWALFFIIDDWSIISDYMVRYKQALIKTHFIRVGFINALLAGVATYTAYVNFDSWLFSLVLIVVLMMLTQSYLRWRIFYKAKMS